MFAERLDKAWTERRRSSAIDIVMRFGNEGLVLGAGTVLAKSGGAGRDISIDPGEPRLRALLAAAHLRAPTVGQLAHLRKAAERWSQGQDALAAMHLVLSRMERLERPEADAHRLFLADGLLRAGFEAKTIIDAIEAGDPAFDRLQKYDPDQPRVPAGSGRASGQWTSMDEDSSAADVPGADSTKPLVYPPQPEVNPSTITEVAQPIGSLYACRNARIDCINAADYAARNDGPDDEARFLDASNCSKAFDACEMMSWIIEDLPLPLGGGVRFPHGGVVLIEKGRLDRYYPPLPGGRPPRITRSLAGARQNSLRKILSMDDYSCPPWSLAPGETVSPDTSEFATCIEAIEAFSSRMGGTITKQVCSFSKQWGRVVRAKIDDGSAGALLVTCWSLSGSLKIFVQLEGCCGS